MSLTAETPVTTLPLHLEPRNPGMPLELDWVRAVQANTSAIERRVASLPGRRSVKKDYQAAWLLKAISCIDLTTLSGDDTPGRVARLCAKARRPMRDDLAEALGVASGSLRSARPIKVVILHARVVRWDASRRCRD